MNTLPNIQTDERDFAEEHKELIAEQMASLVETLDALSDDQLRQLVQEVEEQFRARKAVADALYMQVTPELMDFRRWLHDVLDTHIRSVKHAR